MVLFPSNSGIPAAVHDSVPVALPEAPVELVQVTEVTLADAVPLSVMLASDVETMLIGGEVIANDGGPEGVGGVGGAGGGGATGACLVTDSSAEAVWPALSVTMTVMWFRPRPNAIEAMVHAAAPAAWPDPP